MLPSSATQRIGQRKRLIVQGHLTHFAPRAQVLMKDARTGKKVMFVPLLSSASNADNTDPAFITAVQSNSGRNDIVVQRMCALAPRLACALAVTTGLKLSESRTGSADSTMLKTVGQQPH